MAKYLGNRPTAVPLTSADIQDGVITAADLGANSVDSSELVDNSVTLAKMAGLARGKLIYGDASGDPAALAVGAADEVLTHDGTDFDWAAVAAGGITTADQWRLHTSFAGDSSPIDSNLERVDTTAGGQAMLGSAMTESSGVFTFPSTGYWLVRFFVQWNGGEDRYLVNTIQGTIDDSAYSVIAQGTTFIQSTSGTSSMACVTESIIDVTDVDNVKVKFNAYSNLQSGSVVGTSVTNATYMTFIRLGDT